MMTKATHLLSTLALSFLSPLLLADEKAITVTETIDLIAQAREGKADYHLSAEAELKGTPAENFIFQDDGQLLVTGNGYGYMATQQTYRDYHLILEFKWTGPALGNRSDRARDNGVLVHCHGPAGAFGGAWPVSIEAQIIEGGMGDLLVLSTELPDGTPVISKIESEFERDRDGEMRWKKGAPRTTLTTGRVNWEKRDEDWEDKIDFRGKDDNEAPLGEWNTLEVIAQGDTLKFLFNGQLVNEAFAAEPSAGLIALQTEAAEMLVRRYELRPLEVKGE